MKRSFSILAPLLLTISISASAQDAAPVDVNSVLTTLKTIKKKQADTSKADKARLAQVFQTTAGDPGASITYYEEAIRATKFEGQNRESTQFQAWKMAESDRMKSLPFRNGLSLHLQYLSLTLKRSAGMEVKDLVPSLISFTQQVMSAQDSAPPVHAPVTNLFNNMNNGKKKSNLAQSLVNPKQGPSALDAEWVGKPVTGSIFVAWQQIGDYVSGVENWEMVPGNVDGIYQKTILPEFRRVKDARLLEYWDMKMQREEQNASRSGRNFDVDNYNNSIKPDLLWSRAKELVVLNMKNRAINDMMAVIKTYPNDPSIPDWVSQVEQLVNPPPAAAAATTAAPVAPVVPAAARPEATAFPTPPTDIQPEPPATVPPQS